MAGILEAPIRLTSDLDALSVQNYDCKDPRSYGRRY